MPLRKGRESLVRLHSIKSVSAFFQPLTSREMRLHRVLSLVAPCVRECAALRNNAAAVEGRPHVTTRRKPLLLFRSLRTPAALCIFILFRGAHTAKNGTPRKINSSSLWLPAHTLIFKEAHKGISFVLYFFSY